MNKPFFSVIIPNYCHSIYLDERIQSVLNQTYQNFEVIILDDCSPDNGASIAIIEKYRDNPHVAAILYNETNSGSTFFQWKKGFGIAKGDYVWIAESDDFCELTLLEEFVSALNDAPDSSIVFCKSQLVDQRGNYYMNKCEIADEDVLYSGYHFIKSKMSLGNAIINASSSVFKKNNLDKISDDYQKYVGGGDRRFWIELAEQGDVYYIGKPLNYFRQHYMKVTPKCSLDGTNLMEAYITYKYLVRKRLIKGFYKLYVHSYYVHLIINSEFCDDTVMQRLLKTWHSNAFASKIENVFWCLSSKIMAYEGKK